MRGRRRPPGWLDRVRSLGQQQLAVEDIRDTLNREYPDYPVTSKAVWNLLRSMRIPTRWSAAVGSGTETVPERLALEREIQRLRDENAALRRQKVEALREQNLRLAFLEQVRDTISLLPPPPAPAVVPRERSGASQAAVLAICCLHLGEFVNPVEMAGFGAYDLDIACARWQYCVDSTIDILLNHHAGETFDELYVIDLGDNISGYIHNELAETNIIPVGRQPVLAAHLLSLGLRDLASHFPKVIFIGVPGNHPRLYLKPRYKNRVADNLDTLVYEQVALECSQIPNIEVRIPGSFFHIVNIKGHNIWCAHGDTVRGWAGIPYYGFDRAEARYGQFLSRADTIVDIWLWGNFHTAAAVQRPRGHRVMTGSFKGPDEFALGAVHTGSDPVQVLFGVHPSRGKSFLYDINLKFADPKVHSRYLFPKVSAAVQLAREAGLL